MRWPLCIGLGLLLLTSGAMGQATRPGLSMTIYNAPDGKTGHARITQNRMVDLVEGENRLRLSDLPRSIDPESLILDSVSGPRVWLRGQALEAGAQSPDQLLSSYIGRDVLINRKQQGNDERARHPETINATLLGFDKDWMVLGTSNRQLPLEIIPRQTDISEIKLMGPAVAEGGPHLTCDVLADATGQTTLRLSYSTTGVRWHAAYQLCLRDGDRADVAGVASIENRSGAAISPSAVRLAFTGERGEIEYELPLRGALELWDQSDRQVSLFAPGKNLQVQRVAVYAPGLRIAPYSGLRGEAADGLRRLDEFISIDRSDKAGPGGALPPGKITVLREQANGALRELGAGELPYTPQGSPLMIKTGVAQDLFGEVATQSKTEQQQGLVQVVRSRSIRLINRRPIPAHVLVVERVPCDAQIERASAPARRLSAELAEFEVDVPSTGEATLHYACRVAAAE